MCGDIAQVLLTVKSTGDPTREKHKQINYPVCIEPRFFTFNSPAGRATSLGARGKLPKKASTITANSSGVPATNAHLRVALLTGLGVTGCRAH